MRRILSLFFCLPLLCSAHGKVASVSFIENVGQITDQYHNQRNDIQFKVPGGNLNIFIGDGAIHYQFMEKQSGEGVPASLNMYRMDVSLVGANSNAKVIKEQPNGYHETYYTPGLDGARAFAYNKVIYQNIYPNIDWVIYTKSNTLKYEFVVKQGGKVSDIKMKYAGASALTVSAEGQLVAQTPMGTITEDAPFSYTMNGKEKVASSFSLSNDIISFNVGSYSGGLIIDPTLMWGTYFGGSADEAARGMVTDANGNTIIAGYTNSTSNISFTGAHQMTYGGGANDGFIAKFNSAGMRTWATFYGGSQDDKLEDVAVDASGNVYVGGQTFSTSGIATSGAHLATKTATADQNGLLAKFDASGTRLWGTYYGADNSWEYISGLAYDKAGDNIYAIGSGGGAGISTTGSFQENSGTGTFAFLVKFNASGVRQWGTFYGGTNLANNYTSLADVTVNKMGDVYIVGSTNTSNQIYSTGAEDTTFAGGTGASPWDMFVAKFSSAGNRLWGRYFGGADDDEATAIAVDSNDNVYVGGVTNGLTMSSGNAHQTTIGGGVDGIIAKFSGTGMQQWATYYGGAQADRITSLYVDATNTLYFGGYTSSSTGISSTMPWSLKTTLAGMEDGFVGRMHANGERLWASYYGGVLGDFVYDVSVTGTNDVVIGGQSFSSADVATTGTHQPTLGGGTDYFLAMMDDCYLLRPNVILGSSSICANSSNTYSIDSIAGAASYTWILPNGWTGTSTSRTISTTAGATGGDITITSTNSCGTSEPFKMTVTVNPLPTPTVSASANHNTLSVTGTFTSYQWYKDGSPINGANGQSFTATQTGNYEVEVTDANGCMGRSSAMMAFGTEVKDVNKAKALNIYPNPNNGTFTVSYGIAGHYDLTITNVMGVKVFQTTLEGGKQQTLNVGGNLTAGNYFVEITGAGTKAHNRLTIK